MNLGKIIDLVKGVLLMMAPQLKKADSVEGVKEVQEGLIGVNELSLFLIKRLKDGVGVDDAVATWDKLKNDAEFKNIMKDAVEGYKKMGAEIKDIDAGEGCELAAVQLGYIPRFLEAAKKEVK